MLADEAISRCKRLADVCEFGGVSPPEPVDLDAQYWCNDSCIYPASQYYGECDIKCTLFAQGCGRVIGRVCKTAAERILQVVDYQGCKVACNSVTKVEVSALPVTDIPLLVSGVVSPAGQDYQLYVSGGEAGKEYEVTLLGYLSPFSLIWDDRVMVQVS